MSGPFAPEVPSESPSPSHRIFFGREGLRAGWSLLLFFALLFLSGFALSRILRALHPQIAQHAGPQAPLHLLSVEAGSFALILLVTLLMARIERRPLRAFGIGDTPRALPHFLTGLGWGLLLLSALVGALRALHLLTFTGRLLFGPAVLQYGILWFFGFLFVAFSEEYLLRGYLQFTLARGLAGAFRAATDSPIARTVGFWIAALLLSFLFGFGHKSNPGESPLGLLSAALIGLVFCLSLWRTGSLWWAIGFHAAWDWAQSFLFGVADSGTMIQFHLLGSAPLGKAIFSGGTTGPEGSLLILAVILVAILVVLATVRSTPWPAAGSRLLPDDTTPTPTLPGDLP